MAEKNSQETTIEVITAGLLVMIFGLLMLGNINEPLAMTFGGLILLGSGIYQSRKGWHVSILTWILGLIFLFGGMGVRMFLVTYLRINWVAIALVMVGGYLVLDMVINSRR
jgi:hypothetical protein